MDFSVLQYSKFMTLLDVLLHNLRALHMSLKDSLQWLGEVMAEIGPAHLQKHKKWSIFDIKQANAITDYLKISLFQHYKLYEFLFYSSREEIVLGAESGTHLGMSVLQSRIPRSLPPACLLFLSTAVEAGEASVPLLLRSPAMSQLLAEWRAP
ncbi:hypothetical protein MDA_GLEAN10016676 [Myotis davidii]|uniref:Ciliary-associated calcium-binding coiled-coil protein 1 n=1 Tax=Myotis davidii TaxID=225400 RepID=L5M775_MYODS|nr:hypothetical protein MDA_GLEAN10016676 [Myotis davidii]